MSGISFTANRFVSTQSQETKGDETSIVEDSNSTYGETNTKVSQTWIDNEYFKVHKTSKNVPELNDDETILSIKAETSKIATIITTQRIVVYNYTSSIKQSHFFECSYVSNEFNLLPLCLVIPNPIHELKPDLIIVDAITGKLAFYESIKMTASLGVLQNIKTSKVKLNNAEFLTDITRFQDTDLLLTTSQCRVLYIKLKDYLNDSILDYTEIYNNRSLVSFMLSKSYSIREYNNSNHILAIKLYKISPIEKLIVMLESSGRLVFIKHLNGSTTFSLEGTVEMNAILNETEIQFFDLEFSVKRRECAVLLKEAHRSDLSGIVLHLNDLRSESHGSTRFEIPLIAADCFPIDPKVYFSSNGDICIIKNDNKMVFFDPQFENMSTSWSEMIAFEESMEFYHMEAKNDNLLLLSSNEGIINVEVKKSGINNDQLFYLENHILQFLRYESDSSKVMYNLSYMKISFDQSTLKKSILRISERLMNNTDISVNLNTKYILETKAANYVKLISFAAENYDLENDEELKKTLTTNCSHLSLAAGFYSLGFIAKYSKIFNEVLQVMKFDGHYADFFQYHAASVTQFIDTFFDLILNSEPVDGLVQFAKSFSSILSENYLEVKSKIEPFVSGVGYDGSFAGHYRLMKNINNLLRTLVQHVDKTNDQASLTLSYFLYYATCESIIFHRSDNLSTTGKKLEELYKFTKINWISTYIILNQQDKIIPLVIRYDDMECLAVLIESKREFLEVTDRESMGEIDYIVEKSNVEIEFEKYFDCYGYKFAKSLFEHYIATNKIDVMFSNFSRYDMLIEEFLGSSLEYYNVAWIYHIQTNQFAKVGSKLINYMNTSEYNKNTNLATKRLHSSIGKLSNISALKTDSITYDAKLTANFDFSLKLMKLQKEIYFKIDQMGLIDVKNNHAYIGCVSSGVFKDEVDRINQKLMADISLTITEIITLVTLGTFQYDGSRLMGDDTNAQTIIDSNDEEDFVIAISAKIFELLKHSGYMTNNENTIFNHGGEESFSSLATKLLIRRLVLKNGDTDVLSKVVNVLEHDAVKGYLHDLKSLTLNDTELRKLGIESPALRDEYHKEDDELHSSIDIFRNA